MYRILLFLFFMYTNLAYSQQEYTCVDIPYKSTLASAWHTNKPYAYKQLVNNGTSLTGIDIELIKLIASKININVEFQELDWDKQLTQIKNDEKDLAFGASFYDERTDYSYFSLPYRFEENSLFTLKASANNLYYSNMIEFLAQVRLQNYRLGVFPGYVYADEKLNEFIRDPSNEDIIFYYQDKDSSIHALMQNDIDGFIADRISGSSLILSKRLEEKIENIPLNIKKPVHIIFSKKSVSLNTVENFNKSISSVIGTKEYKQIMRSYLYPVLLLEVIDSKWFYLFIIISAIAFSISGVMIAFKEKATLFGTFLLAMLPTTGGLIRDIITNRERAEVLTSSYMYYVIAIVLVGYLIIQFLKNYNYHESKENCCFYNHCILVCDAIGQSSGIVTGVAVVIVYRIEPIELWGPFLAFITSYGGIILRDIVINQSIKNIKFYTGAEVSILYGSILTLVLEKNVYSLNSISISHIVIFITIIALFSHLVVYYFHFNRIISKIEKIIY